MRITPNATAYNALYNLQEGRSKLDTLNEKLASQVNVNRPSDDPVATSLILSTNDRLNSVEQYSSNITKANVWLNMTGTALQGISDTMTTVKQLVSTITSGSSDSTTRNNVVSQLTALRKQLVDMGNTQCQGQYIFSGAQTATKSFDYATSAYGGDTTVNSINIDTSATQAINITGDRVLTSGTGVNILQTMDELITAVGSNDVTGTTGIQAGAKKLETGFDQVTNLQTEVASSITRLAGASSMLGITKNTLETILGDTQNADLFKLGVQLTQQQTAFEASLSATAKVSKMSLLDYM